MSDIYPADATNDSYLSPQAESNESTPGQDAAEVPFSEPLKNGASHTNEEEPQDVGSEKDDDTHTKNDSPVEPDEDGTSDSDEDIDMSVDTLANIAATKENESEGESRQYDRESKKTSASMDIDSETESRLAENEKTKDFSTVTSFSMVADSPPKDSSDLSNKGKDAADQPSPHLNAAMSEGEEDEEYRSYHERVSTSVTMLDADTCQVVKVFHSMRQAQRAMRVDRKLMAIALKRPDPDGKPGIANGWRWRVSQPGDEEKQAAPQDAYKTLPPQDDDSTKQAPEPESLENSPGLFADQQTAVTMCNKETCEPSRVFRSVHEAASEMGVSRKQLEATFQPQSDRKPGIAGAFRWRLTLPGDEETISQRQWKTAVTAPKGLAMLDKDTCEVIRVFHSMRQAQRELGIGHQTLKDALETLNDGKPGIGGPCRWRLATPEDEESLVQRQKEPQTGGPSAGASTSSTSVTMLDKETCEVIKVFQSMRQVAREIGVDRKDLKAALEKQSDGKPGIAEGYRWRFPRPGDEEAASQHQKATEVAARIKKKRKRTSDLRIAVGSNISSSISRSPVTPGKLPESFGGTLASPSDMEKVAGVSQTDKHRQSDSGSVDGSWNGSDNMRDDESGVEEGEDGGMRDPDHLPAIKHGRLEFTLNGPLQSQLICELCMGYFREPYRITTCLHTFCKSCLLLALERAGHQCPSCQTYLGRLAKSNEIPFKPDRLLHDLMDKVLFPQLATADEEAEAEFYASLGIQKKAEFRENRGTRGKDDKHQAASEKSRMVSFQLVPCAGKSALRRPFLETESTLTISQLKKYLQLQEQKSVSDLYCLGTVLGSEWSIEFVLKTIWNRKWSGEHKLLSLEYK